MSRRLAWVLLLVAAALGLPILAHAGAEATHAHVCIQAATPSTTDIDCADWNAPHVFGGTGATQGKVPYYDTGESTKLNWTSDLVYDETKPGFSLFGGSYGASASRVITIGCTGSVAPTTDPDDSVQAWIDCAFQGGAFAGLKLRDGRGAVFGIGSTSALDSGLYITNPTPISGVYRAHEAGTISAVGFTLLAGGAAALSLDPNLNIGMGSITSFGTSATSNFAIPIGNCPTAAFPADQAQFCVKDRNGAGTASLFKSDEEGRVESLAGLVHARVTTEATNTGGAADMVTLNSGVSIPVGDGAIIRFAFRKSTGASTTVSVGLKINTTQILANTVVTTSDANAYSGLCEFTVWNRAANHLRAIRAQCWSNGTTSTATNLFASADMANATITDIRITGLSGNAAVTLGIRDVVVERIAGF